MRSIIFPGRLAPLLLLFGMYAFARGSDLVDMATGEPVRWSCCDGCVVLITSFVVLSSVLQDESEYPMYINATYKGKRGLHTLVRSVLLLCRLSMYCCFGDDDHDDHDGSMPQEAGSLRSTGLGWRTRSTAMRDRSLRTTVLYSIA